MYVFVDSSRTAYEVDEVEFDKWLEDGSVSAGDTVYLIKEKFVVKSKLDHVEEK